MRLIRRLASECLEARVDAIHAHARDQLTRIAHWTRQKAYDREDHLRILHPGWQPKEGEGPVAEWEKEWIASGFFDDDMTGLTCCLPAISGDVQSAGSESCECQINSPLLVRTQCGCEG